MKSIKLIELLKTLSKDEWKEFEKFIRSPYFNKGRDLVPFYKALGSFYPEFDKQSFTTENIIKKSYPHLKFNLKKSEDKLRVLSSEMLQLGKEFIKYEELKSQKMTSSLIELKSLRKRRLNSLYLKQYSKIINECDSKIMLDIDFFLEYHLIHRDSYEVKTVTSRNIQETTSLFNYFLFESSTIFMNEEAVERNYNIKRNNNFLSNFFKSVDLKKFLTLLKEDPIPQRNKDLIVYFTLFAMFSLDTMNDELLTSFEESFYGVKKYLSKNMKFASYTKIFNYYGLKRHNEKYDHHKHYVMFKNFLEDNIFEPYPGNAEMSPHIFRDIFTIFMEVGETNESQKFLEKYRNYLSPEFSESIYNYCFAKIEIEKENYTKALDYINDIEISAYMQLSDIRNLQLKTFYHLNDTETAINVVQSYRKFLKQNKNVSDFFRKFNLKFLRFYEKLLDLKTSKNIPETKLLSDELENLSEPMLYKDWMRREINKLLS